MRFPSLVWTAVLAGCGVGVTETTDISYDSRFSEDVLDIYNPHTAGTARPAVLVIHGGGWTEGIYRSSEAPEANWLAEAGYLAVNIEYRLTPEASFPAQVQDCFCALAYMRAHATELAIDPDRIAGVGYSAGGHLVSMLATTANDPIVAPDCDAGPAAPLDAVVTGAGIEDMAAMPQFPVVTSFIGASLADDPELYQEASPLAHVAAGDPPYLFVSGDGDWLVNFDHQDKPMIAALDAVGTETRLLEIPGGGHVLNGSTDGGEWELPLTSFDTPPAQDAILDFLDHTIGPPP